MFRDIIIYSPVFVAILWSFVLLISSPKNNKAKFILGIFMLVVFLLFLSHAFYFNKQVAIYWYFDLAFIFCALSVYPLYYCYIKLLTVETKFNIKSLRLFLPAFILLVISAVDYFLMSFEQRNLYVSEVLFNNKNIPNADLLIKIQESMLILVPIMYISQIVYTVIKSRKFIRDYNKTIANFYSNIENKTIDWAIPLLNSLVAASLISVLCSILGRAFFLEETWFLYITMICFSFFFFIAGYLGNLQNHSVANMENDIVFVSDSLANLETVIPINEDPYNSSKLKEELLELFEKTEVFKNSDLKIVDLARMLHTNRTYISNVINNELSCSFNTFVNQYRIQKAKELIIADSSNNYTFEFVSNEVGFGSLHTFIRAFKESEGITPGAFRDKI